nr:MAG TPA: nuclease [Caudoviricetes sp.]
MTPKYIIETTDPRGLYVRCSEKQWNEHIIREPEGHPIMKEKEYIVSKTVTDPDFIYEDKNNPGSRNVYIKDDNDNIYPGTNKCTKVVAQIGGGYADIITAYPTNKNRKQYEGSELYAREDTSEL